MKKRNGILLVVLLVAVASGLAWAMFREPPEPVYQGKKLSVWLKEYGKLSGNLGNPESSKAAEIALRHFGTNYIPRYLLMMTARASHFRISVLGFVPKKLQARYDWLNANIYERGVHWYRVSGANGIIALGPDAKPAVPAVIQMLSDKEDDVREIAAGVLCDLRPVLPEVIPALINALSDTDQMVRIEASLSLSDVRENREKLVAGLMKYLNSDDWDLHHHVIAIILHDFGEAAKPVVPVLIGMLSDKDPEVRRRAAQDLDEFGPVARDALPSLIKCLNDVDPEVRRLAVRCLGDIRQEPERIVPLLIRILDSRDEYLYETTLFSIGDFGPEAKAAVPSLLEFTNSELRYLTIYTLGKIGKDSKPAVPLVLQSLYDEDEEVRDAAGFALQQIDPDAARKAGVK